MTALERLRFELERARHAGLRTMPAALNLDALEAALRSTAAQRPEERSDSAQPAAAPTAAAAPPPATVQTSEGLDAPAELAPAVAPADRAAALAALAEEVRACTACKLCHKRTNAVPGEGALDPPILFVGEGPGRDEDRQGRPFVGRAGELLTKMIQAIETDRDVVFITNIVKCRPPANRTPEPDEVAKCSGFLRRQIELLRPKLICTLGAASTRALVPTVTSIRAARGRPTQFQGIPLIPTYHPAYLLRRPEEKRAAWADLQLIAQMALGREA